MLWHKKQSATPLLKRSLHDSHSRHKASEIGLKASEIELKASEIDLKASEIDLKHQKLHISLHQPPVNHTPKPTSRSHTHSPTCLLKYSLPHGLKKIKSIHIIIR